MHTIMRYVWPEVFSLAASGPIKFIHLFGFAAHFSAYFFVGLIGWQVFNPSRLITTFDSGHCTCQCLLIGFLTHRLLPHIGAGITTGNPGVYFYSPVKGSRPERITSSCANSDGANPIVVNIWLCPQETDCRTYVGDSTSALHTLPRFAFTLTVISIIEGKHSPATLGQKCGIMI